MKRAYVHLELDNQAWIDARVAWLLREFGRDRFCSVNFITLDHPLLTELEAVPEADLPKIFGRIAESIGLDASAIDFYIHDDLKDDDGQSAGGIFYEQEGRFHIVIDSHELESPSSLASTVVHELCHVHLLGHKRVAYDTVDHEPLTDLLGLFFGYGIPFANSALQGQRIDAWDYRFGKHGYMTMAMFGYALALFAQLRQVDGRSWRRHMRPDVKDAFTKSMQFFDQHGLPNLNSVPEQFPMPILSAPEIAPESDEAALQAQTAETNDHDEHDHDAHDENMDEIETPEYEFDGHVDQADETSDRCVYCHQKLEETHTDQICRLCWESIEEGTKEVERLRELESGQASDASDAVTYIMIGLVILFCLLAVVFVLSRLLP